MTTFQLPSGFAFMEKSGRGADILVVDARTGKSTLYPTSLVREIYDLSALLYESQTKNAPSPDFDAVPSSYQRFTQAFNADPMFGYKLVELDDNNEPKLSFSQHPPEGLFRLNNAATESGVIDPTALSPSLVSGMVVMSVRTAVRQDQLREKFYHERQQKKAKKFKVSSSKLAKNQIRVKHSLRYSAMGVARRSSSPADSLGSSSIGPPSIPDSFDSRVSSPSVGSVSTIHSMSASTATLVPGRGSPAPSTVTVGSHLFHRVPGYDFVPQPHIQPHINPAFIHQPYPAYAYGMPNLEHTGHTAPRPPSSAPSAMDVDQAPMALTAAQAPLGGVVSVLEGPGVPVRSVVGTDMKVAPMEGISPSAPNASAPDPEKAPVVVAPAVAPPQAGDIPAESVAPAPGTVSGMPAEPTASSSEVRVAREIPLSRASVATRSVASKAGSKKTTAARRRAAAKAKAGSVATSGDDWSKLSMEEILAVPAPASAGNDSFDELSGDD